ncbi:MAG: hypothetical protein ACRDKB_01265 [Actinomycetota bacterium]
MAKHRGNDHTMHPLTPEFRGDGVTDIVQSRRGMQPGLASEALERRVQAQGHVLDAQAVAGVARLGDELANLNHGVLLDPPILEAHLK